MNHKLFTLPILIVIAFFTISTISADAQQWETDVLGDGYLSTSRHMPDDYCGNVICTIIKKADNPAGKTAILYVHGYNDYFFQKELGDSVVAHGYGFFAVDLRKYGRSLLPGQTRFEVRDISEYYPDIDEAITVVKAHGYTYIVLMGHSTGGLITSCYMTAHNADRPEIKALVLNSPFLDMNLSGFQEKFLIPLVTKLPGKKKTISQGNSNAYAQSLLAKYHGEWEYNTDWKLEISPAVSIGWLTAIHNAHKFIQKKAAIKIPVLLMHSDKSVHGNKWTADHNRADAVLDVVDISKYGRRLGGDVTEVTIADGLHDLILSRIDVRRTVYATIFQWLTYKEL